MNKYPFTYKVVGYDYDNEKFYQSCGLGFCRDGFSDAAHIIEKAYGNELVSIKELKVHAERANLFEMPNELYNACIKTLNSLDCFKKEISEGEANV